MSHVLHFFNSLKNIKPPFLRRPHTQKARGRPGPQPTWDQRPCCQAMLSLHPMSSVTPPLFFSLLFICQKLNEIFFSGTTGVPTITAQVGSEKLYSHKHQNEVLGENLSSVPLLPTAPLADGGPAGLTWPGERRCWRRPLSASAQGDRRSGRFPCHGLGLGWPAWCRQFSRLPPWPRGTRADETVFYSSPVSGPLGETWRSCPA